MPTHHIYMAVPTLDSLSCMFLQFLAEIASLSMQLVLEQLCGVAMDTVVEYSNDTQL